MAVAEQTPYKEYIGNGVTKIFPLGFDVLAQDHLIVLVNDLEPTVGSWSLDAVNDTVAFALPPANGANIKIRRDTPLERSNDYKNYNSSLKPEAINSDLDNIWRKLQEMGVLNWMIDNNIKDLGDYVDGLNDETKAIFLSEIQKQGISLNQLEGFTNQIYQNLANVAVSKGWFAEFVADGDENQAQINKKTIRHVECVADVVDLAGYNGSVVSTKGYHPATNFDLAQPYAGGSTYVYNSAALKATHNGGTIIAAGKSFPSDWSIRENVEEWFSGVGLTGKGCWVLVYSGSVDVTHFGAIPYFSIGIDNSIAINKALSIKNNIHIPTGNYIVHRPTLTKEANPVITGDGVSNTLITVEDALWQPTTYNSKSYNAVLVVTSGVDMSWIEGATINNFSIWGNSYSADGKIGLYFDNVCLKVNVENLEITTCDKGLYTLKSWVHSYKNVTVTDCITNSMHLDTYVNGYSFVGCTLYGKSVVTSKHLVIENASYGNSWTGGAIEKAHVALSLKNNAQITISGVDFEVIDTLFVESVNNLGLPSKFDTCSIMGNPSQSGFATSNADIILENNRIFNPYGNIGSPLFFAEGDGTVVLNNNKYGEHVIFSGGSGKIIGNDLGRYDFTKSKRITNNRVLDAYEEKYQDYFEFFTNTGAAYPRISESFVETKIGNFHNIKIQTLLNKVTTISGDYLTFTIADLVGDGLVGSFVFSKTANILSSDAITGSIYSSSGVCYLIKPTGGLLLKADLNATTDTNLFRLQINYNDSV